MRFQNPANGYEEDVDSPLLWSLLFGPFYFVARGVWAHAALSLLLIPVTAGISWIAYPFFAKRLMRKFYLQKGWKQIA